VFDNGEICFALAYCFGEIVAISLYGKTAKMDRASEMPIVA